MSLVVTETERFKCQGCVHNRMWSEVEESNLRGMYEDTPNSVIANELDKSEQSIKSKARRMGLAKDRRASRLYDTRQKDAEYPTSDDEFAHYVCGFVDGEGSFNYTEYDNKLHFKFAIEVADTDSKIIEEIRQFFDVGRVYYTDARNESWQGLVRFIVTDADSLARTIIPFFKDYGLRAENKRRQFEDFSDTFHKYFELEPKELSSDRHY